jgi:RNA polymerase sigma-70 factor (ECF subfamily)
MFGPAFEPASSSAFEPDGGGWKVTWCPLSPGVPGRAASRRRPSLGGRPSRTHPRTSVYDWIVVALANRSFLDPWTRARAAWPGVDVPERTYAGFVAERAQPDVAAPFDDATLGDLYLACACALGTSGALATFERAILVHVPRFVARLDTSPAFADDVAQILRERLLLGHDGEPPRISAYQGKGPLLAWVRVVALRAGLDLLREGRGRAEVELDEKHLCGQVAVDLDVEVVEARYRKDFEETVALALRELPRRDRNLLRLHLVAGISTHKLGAIFHVDQSTVVRWLATARRSVRETIRGTLATRLGIATDELDSLAGMLFSRFDLSLTGCLRSHAESHTSAR